jgi:hypothetical protein
MAAMMKLKIKTFIQQKLSCTVRNGANGEVGGHLLPPTPKNSLRVPKCVSTTMNSISDSSPSNSAELLR